MLGVVTHVRECGLYKGMRTVLSHSNVGSRVESLTCSVARKLGHMLEHAEPVREALLTPRVCACVVGAGRGRVQGPLDYRTRRQGDARGGHPHQVCLECTRIACAQSALGRGGMGGLFGGRAGSRARMLCVNLIFLLKCALRVDECACPSPVPAA